MRRGISNGNGYAVSGERDSGARVISSQAGRCGELGAGRSHEYTASGITI